MSKMYRADFDNGLESDYFYAENDASAIASVGYGKTTYYSDAGEVYGALIELYEVDPNTECFNELRLVCY